MLFAENTRRLPKQRERRFYLAIKIRIHRMLKTTKRLCKRIIGGLKMKKDVMTCPPPPHLWIDLDNADSVINKAYESGEISLAEAERLSYFKKNGYVIF